MTIQPAPISTCGIGEVTASLFINWLIRRWIHRSGRLNASLSWRTGNTARLGSASLTLFPPIPMIPLTAVLLLYFLEGFCFCFRLLLIDLNAGRAERSVKRCKPRVNGTRAINSRSSEVNLAGGQLTQPLNYLWLLMCLYTFVFFAFEPGINRLCPFVNQPSRLRFLAASGGENYNRSFSAIPLELISDQTERDGRIFPISDSR